MEEKKPTQAHSEDTMQNIIKKTEPLFHQMEYAILDERPSAVDCYSVFCFYAARFVGNALTAVKEDKIEEAFEGMLPTIKSQSLEHARKIFQELKEQREEDLLLEESKNIKS